MITSTQSHYNGEGYNDCLPASFIPARKTSASRPGKRYIAAPLALPPSIHSLNSSPMTHTSKSSLPPPPPSMSSTPLLAIDSSKSVNVPVSIAKSDGSSFVNFKINTPSSETQDQGVSRSSEDATNTSSVSLETVKDSLDKLLSIPSSLPEREFNHYKVRLEKYIPEIAQDHLEAVHKCLSEIFVECADSGETKKNNAKGVIVRHMMVHGAISTWAIPLRKVIEKVQLD